MGAIGLPNVGYPEREESLARLGDIKWKISSTAGATNKKGGETAICPWYKLQFPLNRARVTSRKKGEAHERRAIPLFTSKSGFSTVPGWVGGGNRELEKSDGATTAKHERTLRIRGAPTPCYQPCPPSYVERFPQRTTKKIAPVLRWWHRAKTQLPGPAENVCAC